MKYDSDGPKTLSLECIIMQKLGIYNSKIEDHLLNKEI